MGILPKFPDLPKWVIALLSSLGTAALGLVTWLGTDYASFRANQIETNKNIAEASIKADARLDPFIIKFKNLIVGKGEVAERDRDDFADALRASQAQAADLANKYSSLQASFEVYTAALVGLKLSINNMNGPLDGKKYVTALGKYFVAQAMWRTEVTKAQSSYFKTFALR